ncbi:MAG: pirin family protein [Nitrospirae bacterium]|nr:pirin family protein [Nitrospirota bacterium]
MSQTRKIKSIWKSVPTMEGAGVKLKRAFGNSQVPKLDPFLLMDDFHSNDPSEYLAGFPWHPHRGIETITYVLEGRVEHEDSMGNKGNIVSGDVQWMTAGSGILHQEMPKIGDNKRIWGYQLWANLPAAHKMMEPRYRDLKSTRIPEVKLSSGVTVKVISGRVDGTSGPVKDIVIDPEYLDVSVPSRTSFTHPVKSGHTVFTYVLAGKGYFDPTDNAGAIEVVGSNDNEVKKKGKIGAENLVLYESQGDQIEINTEDEPVRFLLISGMPIGEPVAWYGPIVMNTQEELQVAFEEYQNKTFIKQKAK